MKAWLTYEMFEGKARPTEYGGKSMEEGVEVNIASHTILYLDKVAVDNEISVSEDIWLREIEIPDN
jgi:hypothetical protein